MGGAFGSGWRPVPFAARGASAGEVLHQAIREKCHPAHATAPCSQALSTISAFGREGGGGYHRTAWDRSEIEEQPHAKQTAHAPESALGRENEGRDAVPIASDVEWPMPDAWGKSLGAPIGNARALKHGQHSATVISHRRELSAMISSMRRLAETVDGDD
jgi:hypothetical protein